MNTETCNDKSILGQRTYVYTPLEYRGTTHTCFFARQHCTYFCFKEDTDNGVLKGGGRGQIGVQTVR